MRGRTQEKYDQVMVELLERIVEKGRCTGDELENVPGIIQESQRIMDDLERNGLIEMEQGTVKITERGRVLLRTLNELCGKEEV